MNMREARVRVWQRVAATVKNDIAIGNWVFDESDNEDDHKRLLQACEQVARTVQAMVRRMERK